MAEVVTDAEWSPRHCTKSAKFLDGQVWKLTAADCPSGFKHKVHSLRQNAYWRGMKLRSRIVEDAAYVQAVPK